MCPVCIATLALIATGSASTGGLTAFVAKKIRRRAGRKEGSDRKADRKREILLHGIVTHPP